MSFLMDFTPRASPFTAERKAFTPEERRGAAAFRDHCERCHEARVATDVPLSRVPFDAWEKRIFNVALTPNYNKPHHNHFHLEVTVGVKWFLLH